MFIFLISDDRVSQLNQLLQVLPMKQQQGEL